MSLKLKPADPIIASKLKTFESTQTTLSQATDRWKPLRAIAKQQAAEAPARPPPNSPDEPGPIWIQRMETLFGPPDEQLRVIRCDMCGLQTREVNGRVCVTHKVNCEMTKPARMMKKAGLFAGVEAGSKKRASSEVSLDSSNPPPKKKKATIIDHTTSSVTSAIASDLPAGLKMTNKQLKKVLAQADRMEREKERKEKKAREEEAKKANQKKMGRIKGGPVNVNEQCGVLIPPKDIPCARSLTCKTHSMGAKRSVPGRSAPYDVLLNEWQKKHNPNWGDRKVVTPRVGPGIEPGVSKKKKKEAASARAAMGNTNTSGGMKHGAKDKERDHTKHHGKSNNTHNRTFGGAGGGSGAASGSKKKDGHHHRGEGGRATGDKLSAANEAKLLGEIDEDFYYPVAPSRPQTSMEVDGAIAEDDPTSHSDVEVELIIKGLIASQPGQPLVTSGMGSAWVNPRWSNLGKLGVKESFRDAFRKR